MKKSTLAAALITAAGLGLLAGQTDIQAAEETAEPVTEVALTETVETAADTEAAAEKVTAPEDAAQMAEDTAPLTTEVTESEATPTEVKSEVTEPVKTDPEAVETKTEEDAAAKEEAPAQEADSDLLSTSSTKRPETENKKDTADADAKKEETTAPGSTTTELLNPVVTGWKDGQYLLEGKPISAGLHEIDGQTYYFDASGRLLKGQKKIGDDYYCFDLETGVMKKGITYLSEDYNSKRNGGAKTVYYDLVTGKMRHGQKLIEGDYYCFDINSGAMKTGFTWLGIEYEPFHPKVVYYNEDGKMMHGQKKIDGEWYCFDINSGERKTGLTWLGIEYEPYHPKAVFYDEKGRMRKGIQQIDGKTYAFDVNSGARLTGLTWLGVEYDKENPRAVYFNERGQMETGEKLINGDWYCFDHKTGGRMIGLVTLGKDYGYSTPKTALYSERGKRLTGLQTVNGKQMIFDLEDGAMKTGFMKLGKDYGLEKTITVYADENGIMLTGEQKIDGYWYCFEHETGAMMTGLTELDSTYTKKPKTVLYDEQGRMLYGERMVNGKVYTFDNVTGALLKISQERLKGIDISEHQGHINFSKVAKEVSFAILRTGYSTVTDKRFFEYVNGCNANGIPIPAVYCFSYALNRAEAIAEAQYTMNLVQQAGLSKDTIIFYDFEYDSVRWGNDNGISLGKSDCIRFTDAFCNEVERYGYTSGVYANLDYYNRMYNPSSFKNRVFWYARYQEETEYDCEFHQYGSTGRVSGINGNVDMNWWYL